MPTCDNSPMRCWLGARLALVLVLVLGTSLGSTGCSQPPKLSSKQGVRILQALRTACNSQDTERLARVETALAKAVEAGEVTESEREAFAQIIDWAKRGDWGQANAACKRFERVQVRY